MSILKDGKNTIFAKCDCSHHALEVTNDTDMYGSNEKPILAVSIWNQTPYPYSFKNRMSLIWTLIRGKSMNAGDVILNQDDALELSKFISTKVKENLKLKKV